MRLIDKQRLEDQRAGMLKGFLFAIFGLFYAIYMAGFGLWLTGGGHGWNGPVLPSFVGIVLVPLTGVAVALKAPARTGLARLIAILMLVFDLPLLLTRANDHFWPTLERSGMLSPLLTWGIMLVIWHFIVFALVLTPHIKRGEGTR